MARVDRRTHPRAARRMRAARSRQGAVMLVVLLILLVATATGAVAIADTTSELQSAGNERVATQTRYVAETGIATTISWVDTLSGSGQWLETFNAWAIPPSMERCAEPEIPATHTHHASRTTMDVQMALQQNPTQEVAALNDAVPYVAAAGSGGSGGAAGSAGAAGGGGSGGSAGSSEDTTGSFGPQQTYGLPAGGFVVDITDCQVVPGTLTPGSVVGGGSASYDVVTFHCVLTSRGRLEPSGGSTESQWTLGGAKTYRQRVFSSAHDARAEIITPEMIVAK